MRVRELIDMLKDQPPDAEVELAVVAPVDDDTDDITVDRYSVDGVLPWEDDDDDGNAEELVDLARRRRGRRRRRLPRRHRAPRRGLNHPNIADPPVIGARLCTHQRSGGGSGRREAAAAPRPERAVAPCKPDGRG